MNSTIVKFAAASLTLAWLAGQTIGSGDFGSNKGTKIDTIGDVTVYQSGESKESITLYWRGEISHDMGKHMVAALKKHRRNTDHFIIDISSPGGYVKSGEVLIDYMKKLKPDYTIETRVPNKGKCLSMCVPIFLNGEQRYAGSSTVFMFHRPWVEEAKFGSSVKEQAAQRPL